MTHKIQLRAPVELGIVPTHLKFVGGLVPDDDGRLPRQDDGQLVLVVRTRELCQASPVVISGIQIPYFPNLDAEDLAEAVESLRGLGLRVHFILMVGGVDPMNPADEDAVVSMLSSGLAAAVEHGISDVSSTSVEAWMQEGAQRREGDDFAAAVAQNTRVHQRALTECPGALDSLNAWHIEFLRQGEFQTFTNLERIGAFIGSVNEALGQPFFKALVDAAHCGDSDLPIERQLQAIGRLAERDELGIYHASAKTTRGCLSTDDGWVGMTLAECAKTGKLETVFVEMFHHEDAALEGLRRLDPRHGVDTRDGRTWDQVVIDGLVDVTRRLNNFVTRGILGERPRGD